MQPTSLRRTDIPYLPDCFYHWSRARCPTSPQVPGGGCRRGSWSSAFISLESFAWAAVQRCNRAVPWGGSNYSTVTAGRCGTRSKCMCSRDCRTSLTARSTWSRRGYTRTHMGSYSGGCGTTGWTIGCSSRTLGRSSIPVRR